ncbi:MAG: TetR/AcrR family transcriptional regulator [Methylophilaceae bacterium]
MPPKLKTEAEKQKIRTNIIDAARDLFVSKGIEAVTMREIAKRIGYSATTIYLYFADKEALLRAICDTDLLKLAATLKEVLALEDPVERLLTFGHTYALFSLAYPNHYRLMFMMPRPVHAPESSSIIYNNHEQDAYFQLKTVVNEVYEAGLFKPELDDPELIAQTLWAATHGVCALHNTMANDTWIDWRDIETRLLAMRKMIIRGMLKVPYE